jgi:hypothetical protein
MSFVAKRELRRAGLIGLAVVLFLIVVVSLPAVQLRIARAAFSGLDGVDVGLDHVWAGPRGVTVDGLRVAMPGLEASVERLDVSLALWSSLTRLGLDVERVEVRGVDVRVTPTDAAPAPPSAPREPFGGLARVAKLPKSIRVRALSVDGHLALRTATEVEVSSPWRLTLSDLGAGGTATLRVDASPESRRAGDLVAAGTLYADATAPIAAIATARFGLRPRRSSAPTSSAIGSTSTVRTPAPCTPRRLSCRA